MSTLKRFASRRLRLGQQSRAAGESSAESSAESSMAAVDALIVGVRDAKRPLLVDAKGAISPLDGSWRLSWWVGADDRWRRPSDERGVRQRTIDGTPVIETLLRVPSGDVAVTVWGAVAGKGEAVVVEVENRSKVPCAIAFVLEPTGRNRNPVSIVGTELRCGRELVAVLAREPGMVCRAADVEALWTLTSSTRESDAASVGAPTDALSAAIVPLAHTASVRLLLPSPGLTVAELTGGALGDAERVANGWKTQLRATNRLVLGDDGLREALDLAQAAHLIDRSSNAGALAAYGHTDAAVQRLGTLFVDAAAPLDERVADLHSLARYVTVTADTEAAEAALERVAAIVGDLTVAARRGALVPAGDFAAAADIVAAAGQHEAAEAVRALAVDHPPALDVAAQDVAPDRAVSPLDGVALLAWHDALVDDRAGGTLVLLGAVPQAWLSGPIEVHGLASRYGRVSFALRWHGDRPALLWEIDPHDGAEPLAKLRVPRLSSAWFSRSLKGEDLLPNGNLPNGNLPIAPSKPPGSVGPTDDFSEFS